MVSQSARVITGTDVFSCSSSSEKLTMWTREQFAAKFGRAFNNTYDCVCVMNGDMNAMGKAKTLGAWYQSGTVGCFLSGHGTGSIRINYAIFLRR